MTSPFHTSYRAGIAAAQARHGGVRHGAIHNPYGAAAGDWFTPGSVRKARIKEVDDKIARFAQDIDLADNVPAELRQQFIDFRTRWEDWVSSITGFTVDLPGPWTDEWIDRAEQQLALFETAIRNSGATQSGIKGGAQPFKASNILPPPKPPDDGWKTFALVLLGAAAVGTAVLVLSRPTVNVLPATPTPIP
jgi:hypothetical protein